MEFLDISSLGAAYRYAVKIEQKLKQKTREFGPGKPSQKKPGKGMAPTHKTKDREKMDNIKTTSPRRKQRRTHWKDKERYREVV
jgi:hypothetical protein